MDVYVVMYDKMSDIGSKMFLFVHTCPELHAFTVHATARLVHNLLFLPRLVSFHWLEKSLIKHLYFCMAHQVQTLFYGSHDLVLNPGHPNSPSG